MASASSLLVVEEVAADKNEDAETRQVSATLQVNGERFTHAFTVTKDKPTMGVLNNWTVKNSLAAQVSVDAQGYTQFTVGGVSADAPRKLVSGKPATYFFYPASTRSRPSPRANTWMSTPRPLPSLNGVHGGTASSADAADVVPGSNLQRQTEGGGARVREGIPELLRLHPGEPEF